MKSKNLKNTKIENINDPVKIERVKSGLWQDHKFLWLIASVALVAVFEFLSLLGEDYMLRRDFALPFFAVLILAVGWRTLWNGLKASAKLNFRSINLLMTIAVVGAFYLGEYEEAAVVIVLFSLGERLESFGIQTSKSALQALVDRTPKTAKIKNTNGQESELPLEKIKVGDVLIIKPSDMIALDAEVLTGASSVDESTITGEPLPKDKHKGDAIFAGTLNMQGYLEAEVTKTAKDTTLAKIIETTFAATKTKAETQKFIETFAGYYTPSIIVIAALLVLIPTLVFGAAFDPWFEQAITILVIACPCALVISTPISIYAAIGNASAKGALVKGGKYIEAIGRIKVVAMDKTRTLTYGKPKVTDVIAFGETTREHLLACAAGIETYSEHPLAQAIVQAANEERIEIHAVENFQAVMGKGAKADCVVCYDSHHCIGKLPFITEEHNVQDEIVRKVQELQKQGKTSIVISSNKTVEGVIALTDEIKIESKQAVAELRELDVEIVMITGDNHAPAMLVAKEVGITEVKAEMLPEDKADAIRELLQKYGATAMVGDGVNDAPALALSSVGIAMGAAGSDTAIEAASIAILNDRLELIPYLVRLGRRAISTIKINTAAAIATKLVFIVLAILGVSSLAMAIFADVGVTVLVILNSLRLLKFK
ncbi:MAG: cation-translocating P-type ATPase [Pyrinomonadaceae bacterium]|nr:cation-translocating P-type ATPase [Pyrinomonadaceae bacterium]